MRGFDIPHEQDESMTKGYSLSAQLPFSAPYLLNGARFKLSFYDHGETFVFAGYEKELSGKWVALVDATDNQHMRAAQPPVSALPDAILNVAESLHTQDNRITANPLFAVEVRKRVYGIDPEWGGPVVWLHDGEEVTDPDEVKQPEQGWENGDDDPDNYTRTSYYEYWEFVTACLTEEGCKAYIRRNGHNHRGEKRIYAHGGYRNHEWEEVRRYLMSLRPYSTATKCEGQS